MIHLEGLIDVQIEQKHHDERAHADILALPVQRRITHMTLHFAKYAGALVKPLDEHTLQRLLLDTFIISLASANCLNIDLGSRICSQKQVSSISELCSKYGATDIQRTFLFSLSESTGRLAKACESLDHLEPYDYRQVLEREVTEITAVVLALANILGLALDREARKRWREVEEKNVLFSSQPTDDVIDASVARIK